MKILFVGVNAKYIHTNLAIRYLHDVVSDMCECKILEFSINDNVINIEREIISENPDVISLSCYIWNIEFVLQISSDIKKMNNDIQIILGGPEVSYDSYEMMSKFKFIDYIVKGEGEISFKRLIEHIKLGSPIPEKGVTYRNLDMVVDLSISDCVNFDNIPFPYKNNIAEFRGKILYYESSRGCPYSCKYCLSGEKGNVRFKNVEEVKRDLSFFDSNNVYLVKFVDRTFNADRKRAIELWKHIGNLPGNTRFHMEITGELLNDETIEVLKSIPSEKLQFEIGVQTTNSDTLHAIDRKCNKQMLFNYIKRLIDETQIHIHLDLIVGLPHEGVESFKNSFDEVMSLTPHVLQIGFLKLLKGSSMRREADAYNIKYRDKAPYEIISSADMSYKDILYLKDIENIFDKYYNSGSFNESINYLFTMHNSPFDVFSKIVNYFNSNKLNSLSHSKEKLYAFLYNCFNGLGNEFEKSLRKDYIKNMTPGKLPEWCNTDEDFKTSQKVYDFLIDENIKLKVMPKYHNVPAKAIIKHMRFERFDEKVICFDYKTGEEYDVSDYFNA